MAQFRLSQIIFVHRKSLLLTAVGQAFGCVLCTLLSSTGAISCVLCTLLSSTGAFGCVLCTLLSSTGAFGCVLCTLLSSTGAFGCVLCTLLSSIRVVSSSLFDQLALSSILQLPEMVTAYTPALAPGVANVLWFAQ